MRLLFALLLNALLLPTLALAESSNLPFDLTAQTVSYDVSNSKVIAEGTATTQAHVKSSYGNLLADTIVYDLAANKVSARGHVAYTDTTSTTLRVDSLELTGDLRAGDMQHLDVTVPKLGNIASADSGEVSGDTYTFKNIYYSPCKTCEGERKPWSIEADEAVYRRDKSDLTYKNAKLDVYGVPVMYLPWLRHGVGPSTPKSGLLFPQIGKSEALGEELTVAGYVYSPSENADYTIRNRLMSERGDQIGIERRQVGLTTNSEIKVSYLNDDKLSKVRSDMAVMAEKDFDVGRRIGINGEIVSDKTYLSQFYDRLDPYLPSTIYGEDADEHHYYALSMTHFQDLSTTQPSADTAQVYPHLELEKWFALDSGGQLTLQGDAVNIYRGTGSQDRRVIGEMDYTRPWLLEDGSKVTLGAQARGDFYNITNSSKNGYYTRVLPEANLTWEKPYISPDGGHTIAPKVEAIVSPRGGNGNDKVPNEDSVGYELDTSNLFETSRFAGRDRVETGPRLIYGLDNRWGTPDHTNWRVFAGQSLRRYDDSTLPADGGASTNVSDWVGELEANPVDWVSFSNNFRLDNATFEMRRSDTSMQIGRNNGAWLRVTHSYLDHGPEEIYGEFNLPLTDVLTFKGSARKDLANEILLESEAGFTWVRDCYQIELLARRRGYSNGDLQPGTDYLLNLKLLTLGNDS